MSIIYTFKGYGGEKVQPVPPQQEDHQQSHPGQRQVSLVILSVYLII